MKKILMLIFLAGAVNAAVAQETPKPKSAKDLNLTEEQDKKVKNINRSFMADSKAVYKDSTLSKDAKKSKLDALNVARNNEMKSVLNEEQYAKWESNRKEANERMHRSRKPGGDRKSGERQDAAKSLGLNDAQAKEMKSINKDFMSRVSVVRDNKDLSKEQRMAEMKKLHEERMAKLKTTLGDEKFAQYSEMQKKMRKDGMRKHGRGQRPAPKPNVQ